MYPHTMQSISVRFTSSPVPMPMPIHKDIYKPDNIRALAYYHITPSTSPSPSPSSPAGASLILPPSPYPTPSMASHSPSPSSPAEASPSPNIVGTTIIFTLILIILIFCYRSVLYRFIKKYQVKVKVNDDNQMSHNMYSVNFKNTNIHQQLHPTAYNKLNIINRTTKSSAHEISPV
jgi:hypothetical protein